MNPEKQLIVEAVAPGPSGRLQGASLFASVGSALADKAVLHAHDLLQALLKLLFHLQQEDRNVLRPTNTRSKRRTRVQTLLDLHRVNQTLLPHLLHALSQRLRIKLQLRRLHHRAALEDVTATTWRRLE